MADVLPIREARVQRTGGTRHAHARQGRGAHKAKTHSCHATSSPPLGGDPVRQSRGGPRAARRDGVTEVLGSTRQFFT